MPDRQEIYELYWIFRKEHDLQFNIFIQPELFAAWLTVSGKMGTFGNDVGAARLLYQELKDKFILDKGKLKERLAEVQRLLGREP